MLFPYPIYLYVEWSCDSWSIEDRWKLCQKYTANYFDVESRRSWRWRWTRCRWTRYVISCIFCFGKINDAEEARKLKKNVASFIWRTSKYHKLSNIHNKAKHLVYLELWKYKTIALKFSISLVQPSCNGYNFRQWTEKHDWNILSLFESYYVVN